MAAHQAGGAPPGGAPPGGAPSGGAPPTSGGGGGGGYAAPAGPLPAGGGAAALSGGPPPNGSPMYRRNAYISEDEATFDTLVVRTPGGFPGLSMLGGLGRTGGEAAETGATSAGRLGSTEAGAASRLPEGIPGGGKPPGGTTPGSTTSHNAPLTPPGTPGASTGRAGEPVTPGTGQHTTPPPINAPASSPETAHGNAANLAPGGGPTPSNHPGPQTATDQGGAQQPGKSRSENFANVANAAGAVGGLGVGVAQLEQSKQQMEIQKQMMSGGMSPTGGVPPSGGGAPHKRDAAPEPGFMSAFVEPQFVADSGLFARTQQDVFWSELAARARILKAREAKAAAEAEADADVFYSALFGRDED